MASVRVSAKPTNIPIWPADPKVLLMWLSRLSILHKKLSFNVLREICPYIGASGFLPGICENYLRLYHLPGAQVKEAFLSVSFTLGTVYCVVDEQTVLCMCDFPPTPKVYALDLDNYQLTPMREMQKARSWPGVLKHKAFVYLFGGAHFGAGLKECEKFNLDTRSWISLPNMKNERSAFTPCLFEEEVYLPDSGKDHKVMETFNLLSEEFQTLPVPLPLFVGGSVAFIINEELVIIAKDRQIGKWRVKSTETSFRVSNVASPGRETFSNSPPVRVGREVFWVRYNTGNLAIFNLDSNMITKR